MGPTGAPVFGPAGAYLAAELGTAPPRKLQVLLYDQALKLCRRAAAAMADGDGGAAAKLLRRAREIVEQLEGHLLGETPGEAIEELSRLYRVLLGRLMEAELYGRAGAVHRTVTLMSCYRPAWTELVRAASEAGSERAGRAQEAGWVG